MKSVVFSLLLSLAAPWGAMCLADAPGPAMACCRSGQTAPMVRPCCAMSPDRTGVTVQTAAQALAPMPLVSAVVPPAEGLRFHRAVLTARSTRPIEIRLLTSVFQI
jgi:hypothetical protein